MKKLLLLLAALFVLLLVGYFVVTSSAFVKSVVLPRVGAAINAKVEADSVALSPLSSVEIRKLSITPNGADTLATAEAVRVRFRLFDILGGKLSIDEIHVSSPVVTVVKKADGSSNLDPILKQLAAQATGAAPPPPTAVPGKPIQLDLKSFVIENGNLRYRAAGGDGSQTGAEVTGLAVKVANMKNAGSGRVEISSGIKLEQRAGGANASNNLAQGTIKGGFDLALTPDLMPAGTGGKLEAQIQQTSGTFKEFAGYSTVVTADLTPGELKRLAIEFMRQGTALGAVTASGPLDFAKKEGKLQVDLTAIDRNVLNLFGAAMGLDFTTTRFDSTNRIEIANAGQKLAITGTVTGSKVSVKKGELTVPPVDARKTYDLTVDLEHQTATIRTFSLSASQAGREIVRGTLSQPMQVSWAPNAGPLPDAAINLVISDLRLADWSALAGAPVVGTINARADIGMKNAGKDLGIEATASVAGLSGDFGTNSVRNLGLNATANLAIASFADAAKRTLKALVDVKDLTGEAAVVKFDHYGLELKADLGLPAGQFVINDLFVRLRQGSQEGGALNLKGRWDTTRGAGDITLAAKGINENGLRPMLQAALGDKQLRSINLSADVAVKIDPAADASVKATTEIKDLVVRDPSGTVPESPLAAGLSLDASGSAQKVVIRQGELRLTPTARAKNVANLSGDLDLSRTNALRGAFKLTSESMDVTPFVDLFTSNPKAAAPAPSPGQPAPKPAGPQTEPAAIQLPVDVLTLDVNVGKFYLREIAAENFVAAVKVTGSRIDVQPLQLTLNGAPIKATAKLNLGVPGYEYDVNFAADRVPVKPIANSFVPMLKDRIEGNIIAGADIKGAGVTGSNLRKHLVGGLNLSVTNANLKLATSGNQKPGILTLLATYLATALNIRELKDQPIMEIMAVAKLGDGKIDLTQAQARSASLEVSSKGGIPIADDLMASPLNFPVNVSLTRELAMRARLVGTNTPTNAVYVALPAIASVKGTLGAPAPEVDTVKAGLLAARGIAGLVGGRAGEVVGGVTDLIGGVAKGDTNAVGNLIQGIGGLLGGNKNSTAPAANKAPTTPTPTTAAPSPSAAPASATGTNTNKTVAPATNAAPRPATNAPAPRATTNAPATSPATNAAPATNSNAAGSLLKGLLDKDKKKP